MSLLKEDGASQKERMCTGRLYYALRDPELLEDRNKMRKLCGELNATPGPGQTLHSSSLVSRAGFPKPCRANTSPLSNPNLDICFQRMVMGYMFGTECL